MMRKSRAKPVERCVGCTLLFCDFISRECRLSAGEVVRHQPQMVLTREERNRRHLLRLAAQNAPHLAAKREQQKACAAMGFKKYDRRYKNARRYWKSATKGHGDATPSRGVRT